jgi:SAM-dependent methyltransferase
VTAWYDAAFDDLYAEIYAHRDDAEAETAIGWLVRALPTVGVGELRGRRVLDLACGAGRHLRALAGQGAEPIGIDRSTALLARAKVGLPEEAALVAGDLRTLPFADQHVHEPGLLRCRERSRGGLHGGGARPRSGWIPAHRLLECPGGDR